MSGAVSAFASIILLLWSFVVHPQHARCPRGWFFNGIRATGDYECRPTPQPDEYDHGQPPGELHGRIYCTGGTIPILNDHSQTVGCQRGNYQ